MKKIKLLIVDNHQIILDGIAAFLEKEINFEIVGFALNGQKALDFLVSNPVDVIILDINMPVLNGLETAKQVKRLYPATKIILLTLENDGHFVLRGMRMGVHGYVVKEKSKEVLVQAIYSVFSGSSYWSPDLLSKIADAQLVEPEDIDPVKLSTRELNLIKRLSEKPALTAKELAEEFNIAVHTVNTHIRNAKQKLGMSKTSELIKYYRDTQ